MFELIARRLLALALTVFVAVNLAVLSDMSKAPDPAPFLETAAVHVDSENDGWTGGGDWIAVETAPHPVPLWVPPDLPSPARAAVPVRRFTSAEPTGPPSRPTV